MPRRARKSPLLKAIILSAGSLATGTPAAGQALDLAGLEKRARRAESEYEASIRRHAPVRFSTPQSRPCDEVVGRFCIYYEAGGDSLPGEPAEVSAARGRAIAALSAAHAAAPGSEAFVYPLVRYLAEAGRPTEAVSVAQAFSGATGDRAAAHMVNGFALHAARDTRSAEMEFGAWLDSLPADRRGELSDAEWLLDRKERQRYGRLALPIRAAYAERLWRYADPLYLTAGNEAWTDHLARQALAFMLARRRGMVGVESWGDDVHELTVRFGQPVRTTRSWRSGSIGSREQFTEHWDPALRTYVAPDLESALRLAVRLDTVWPIDSLTARSGHAPPTIRLMRVLEHQAAVFGDSARVLLIRGVARRDTLPVSGQVHAAVFLLDSALQVVGRAPAALSSSGDSLVLRADVRLPPAAEYYSAEIYDPESRFAARARFAVADLVDTGSVRVSSLLLSAPYEPRRLPPDRASPLLDPLVRPVVVTGSRLGLYAEVIVAGAAARTVSVQIENRRTDRPSALGKVVGWIGRTIGLSSQRTPARIGWSFDVKPGDPNPLPVTLDLGSIEPGRYRLILTVRDPRSGETAVSERDMLVVKAPSASRP